MVARRQSGEPLQYVLGHWPFRHLDLLVDHRVLIPRPETEQLVDVALGLAREQAPPLVVADLGTGSGAIALALASELHRADATVWACDSSPAALEVAAANLAGIGRAGTIVRISAGSWYEALPDELRGRLGMVVSNPPYIGRHDPAVEDGVRAWEPRDALFAGDDGLDALREILGAAAAWLRPGGALVSEIGSDQGEPVAELARGAGLIDVAIEKDLAGHVRFVVARRGVDAAARAATTTG
jgi:release factor glutamine methyltransferase